MSILRNTMKLLAEGKSIGVNSSVHRIFGGYRIALRIAVYVHFGSDFERAMPKSHSFYKIKHITEI